MRQRRRSGERARVRLTGFQDSTGNQGIATEINGKTEQTPGTLVIQRLLCIIKTLQSHAIFEHIHMSS